MVRYELRHGTQLGRSLQPWRGSVSWRSQGLLTPRAVEKVSHTLKSLTNLHSRRYVLFDHLAQLLAIKNVSIAWECPHTLIIKYCVSCLCSGWSRAPTSEKDCDWDWCRSETFVTQKCQTVAPQVWSSWGRGDTELSKDTVSDWPQIKLIT